MKLTDYVADFLAKEKVHYAFGVTGGAVVHFFDSIKKHPHIEPIFTHHEQSASFAAEAYARVSNNFGACFITTGPGGTNALTGLCAAWLDSIPCIFISGQQRLEHTNHEKPFRQMGSQQIDIVTLVKSITKYAVMLQDPMLIKYELQKAIHIAKQGRPGPVWVDIPLNFQWLDIDIEKLKPFIIPNPEKTQLSRNNEEDWKKKLPQLIADSKRPLAIIGYGTRLAHAENELEKFINTYQIPFVTTWNTLDIQSADNPLYVGCCGIAAQRSANLAVQNCDLLLALGSHLSMCITGSNFKAFAREAKKVVVDIDSVQIENPTVPIDMPIQIDVKKFLEIMNQQTIDQSGKIQSWLEKCHQYKSYNRPKKEWWGQSEFVNPYVFLDLVSDELSTEDTLVVDGGGTALYMSFQGIRTKKGQRLIVSSGIGCMGSGLPESIGACFASDKKRTICTIGDGSLQFNIQELQTLVHHQLPVKVLCFNNQGYLSIRITQDGFLEGRHIGTDNSGGISFPDYQKIAEAYGVKHIRISNHQALQEKIHWVLNEPGPVLCEVLVSPHQELIPRLGFKKNVDGTGTGMPLEDMEPFLDRKEFLDNMVVKPLLESIW